MMPKHNTALVYSALAVFSGLIFFNPPAGLADPADSHGGAIAMAANVSGDTSVRPQELLRLSKGEVLIQERKSSSDAKQAANVEAKILIPKPPEQVFPMVLNQPNLMKREPKVKQVKTLSKAGNRQQVEYTVVMSRLLPTFQYVLQLDGAPPNEVRFHRVSGSFKDVKGSWKMTPVDQGKKTVLTYNLFLDPGSLYPNFLVNQILKADLPSMMKNVKTAILTAAN